MGCNCKGTTKGVANNSQEKWLVQKIYLEYQETIGTTTIQYFTKEQRTFIIEKYYEVYPNSKEVTYKVANREVNKLFDYHKLR